MRKVPWLKYKEEQETSNDVYHVDIYTDGSFDAPNKGGWAAILMCNEQSLHVTGAENSKFVDNCRMELIGVIKALGYLKYPCVVNIYSDSAYVVEGINNGVLRWRANNWRNSSRKHIKNQDLWEAFLRLSQPHNVRAIWVKGHAGDVTNEQVDNLAMVSRLSLNNFR